MKNLFPDYSAASPRLTASRHKRIRLRPLTLCCRALCVLLTLRCLAVVARADVTPQELQQWVDGSTLIFTGEIKDLNGNVSSISANDHPMTVQVNDVQLDNATASQNFGSLVGKKVTVVVNPAFIQGPERKVGVSATFFVNPLLYEKNIAVTAEEIADDEMVDDLAGRLKTAVIEKQNASLKAEVKGAKPIVTGVVQEIRELPKTKIDRLRRLANGRDLYSEHSPGWTEAVIRVQSVLKGDSAEKMLIVVFPSTEDRMWEESPKFTKGQRGTWLLHGFVHGPMQINDERAQILLMPEPTAVGQLKVYTALRREDFRPRDSAGKNEAQIRDILKSFPR